MADAVFWYQMYQAQLQHTFLLNMYIQGLDHEWLPPQLSSYTAPIELISTAVYDDKKSTPISLSKALGLHQHVASSCPDVGLSSKGKEHTISYEEAETIVPSSSKPANAQRGRNFIWFFFIWWIIGVACLWIYYRCDVITLEQDSLVGNAVNDIYQQVQHHGLGDLGNDSTTAPVRLSYDVAPAEQYEQVSEEIFIIELESNQSLEHPVSESNHSAATNGSDGADSISSSPSGRPPGVFIETMGEKLAPVQRLVSSPELIAKSPAEPLAWQSGDPPSEMLTKHSADTFPWMLTRQPAEQPAEPPAETPAEPHAAPPTELITEPSAKQHAHPLAKKPPDLDAEQLARRSSQLLAKPPGSDESISKGNKDLLEPGTERIQAPLSSNESYSIGKKDLLESGAEEAQASSFAEPSVIQPERHAMPLAEPLARPLAKPPAEPPERPLEKQSAKPPAASLAKKHARTSSVRIAFQLQFAAAVPDLVRIDRLCAADTDVAFTQDVNHFSDPFLHAAICALHQLHQEAGNGSLDISLHSFKKLLRMRAPLIKPLGHKGLMELLHSETWSDLFIIRYSNTAN